MNIIVLSTFLAAATARTIPDCDKNGMVVVAPGHLKQPDKIESPKNGTTYPVNSLCRWHLYGPGPFWVWMDAYFVDIKGCDTDCSCGYLKLTKASGKVIGKYCTEFFDQDEWEITDDGPIIYSEEPVEIEFYSSGVDASGHKGFEIQHHTASSDCYDADWEGLTPGEYKCENNGYCYPNSEWYPLCTCRYGYYGDVCQYKDRCQFNPCQNGGTCQRKADDFKCKCATGYTGRRCDIQQ